LCLIKLDTATTWSIYVSHGSALT